MSSELIRKLLENEYLKKRVNDRDDMGWTSLALACRKASSDTVLMLLDAGADTEKHPNNSLDRPLHIALRARNMEVVMALISHGADVTATGDRGQSTLHIVRNVGLTQILIQHGANVDALDDWGHTPLHMCYDAKTLIEHGADVNLADVNGWTAAHHAVHVGNLVLFSLLARSGANLNLRRKDSGQTVWEQIKEEVDESLHWTFTRAVETWIV
jgi:ankyrin repeat protein